MGPVSYYKGSGGGGGVGGGGGGVCVCVCMGVFSGGGSRKNIAV